ncbi:MAG TPA: hypothetical protein VFU83_02040, partial [Pyrinomonadaceae bacterium]|nr:hypothetical protein [Pyrinomonadaceae bacterium]
AWRVLQFLALLVVVLAFYKVVRNFNRPVPLPARAVASANRLIFLNYFSVMHQVQEKASAIIHNNDKSGVAEVIDRAKQAPAPDEQATELRERVVVILTTLGQAEQLDQKVVDEYKEWQKEYNQWLKRAGETYTAAR